MKNLPLKKIPRGIIFDCDGVLIDSKNANVLYYNTIRKSLALPNLTSEEEDFVHSTTLQNALESVIPEPHLQKVLEDIKKIGFTFPTEDYISIDPALPLVLELLKKHTIHIGIFTNRRRESLMKILRHFSIDTFFNPIMTPDNVPPKPEATGLKEISAFWGIPMQELLFIGDTMADAAPAMAVSIPFFSFNNTKIPSLYNLNDFNDFLSILQNLLEDTL